MPCLPDVFSKWILCSLFPSSVLTLPSKPFLLVTACSPSFSAAVWKERFFYRLPFKKWLWPVPSFFPSFLLLCALKKRWIDPDYFIILVLISAFQKEIFCKESPCYINQIIFQDDVWICFVIAHTTSNTHCLWTKWKRMLHLIVFQLSSVGRRFNVVKAMDQDFALWIDFYVKQTK